MITRRGFTVLATASAIMPGSPRAACTRRPGAKLAEPFREGHRAIHARWRHRRARPHRRCDNFPKSGASRSWSRTKRGRRRQHRSEFVARAAPDGYTHATSPQPGLR